MSNVNFLRKWFRNNVEAIIKAVEVKGVDDADVELCLKLDAELTSMTTQLEDLHRKRKTLQGKQVTETQRSEAREVSTQVKEIKTGLENRSQELHAALLKMPNIAWSGAPVGPDDKSNVEIRVWGTPTVSEVDHHDHVTEQGWVNFEGARKSSGSRAYAVQGGLALIEQALHALAIRKAVEQGFTPVFTPSLCLAEPFEGTGWFPGGSEEVYKLEGTENYLAGTSEVPLLGFHIDEVLKEEDLPILYAGISPCFRKEAGSAGRDTRGLLRVHEFRKIELFVIGPADHKQSADWHSKLLTISEEILQELKLPYRVVETSTGDMGLGKFRMNDLEVWMPSQNTYRESNSCSTLHDWQAIRSGIRYRDTDGSMQFAHTLNNTAVATPRLLAAIIENHVNKKGVLELPDSFMKLLSEMFGPAALQLLEPVN